MVQNVTIPPQIPSLIGGEWQPGNGGSAPLLDKFSARPVAEIALVGRDQVADAVAMAAAATRRGVPTAYERGQVLDRAAAGIEARQAELGEVLRIEAGFTAADAQNEVARCAQTLRLCAQEARRLCGDMVPMEGAAQQGGRLGFTLRVPLGTVCAITPFNSPLNVVAHKIGPALAAGNAAVLKSSLFTPFSANLLAQVLLDAGVPGGMLSVLHGDAQAGQWLLEERELHFFAFTGSTEVGRRIQARLGLRRSQMELGSIAHVVVDATADIARAVPRIVGAGFRKAGQVCTSTQVLLVHRSRYDDTLALLREQVAALTYGDPAAEGVVIGPLISEPSAQRVQDWVDEARAQGATALVGGTRERCVVAPTLLVDTAPGMKVRRDEVFGPVLSVLPFDDFGDALAQVNGTPYGLSAGVFTNDMGHALRAARTLRSGSVHINEASSARVDLMPFGGSKDSGFGREGPAYAVREMTEERLVTFSG